MAGGGREGREGLSIYQYESADQMPYVAVSTLITNNNHVALALTYQAYHSYWLAGTKSTSTAFAAPSPICIIAEILSGRHAPFRQALRALTLRRRTTSPIVSHIPSSSPRRPLLLLTTHRSASASPTRYEEPVLASHFARLLDPFSLTASTACTGDLALI
jgi:hypothetical protein